jgi:hypothetical protein
VNVYGARDDLSNRGIDIRSLDRRSSREMGYGVRQSKIAERIDIARLNNRLLCACVSDPPKYVVVAEDVLLPVLIL